MPKRRAVFFFNWNRSPIIVKNSPSPSPSPTSAATRSDRQRRALPALADAVVFREADAGELRRINEIIAAAMDTWRLSERVKRISLPLYRYQADDLEHLQIIVAATEAGDIVGVAAIEAADPGECPAGQSGALLHGLYIDPRRHRSGLGTRLLQRMETIAVAQGFDGLLVKAQREATAFFEARGFTRLPIEDHSRDYPYRYWKPC